jgi:hypothetical protein
LKQILTFSTLKFSISFTSGVGAAAFATKLGARFGNARVDARSTDIKAAFEASIEALKAFSLTADMATHLEVSLIDCLFPSATALLVERSTGIEKQDASITKTIANIAAIFIIEPGKNIALHGREERKKEHLCDLALRENSAGPSARLPRSSQKHSSALSVGYLHN